jgi:hypothetical protein
MFPKAALARNLRAQTSPEAITIRFRPLIEPTARIHHFGEEAPVDPHPQLNPHRYPARGSSA